MNARWLLKSCILLPALATAAICVAAPPPPKAFAVFTTSYNTDNDLVRGGVCGSLFFVSPTEAITANHVLNAKSFKPLPGFQRVRVWLVHENAKPIELKPEYLQTNKNKDLTLVHLPLRKRVPGRFVFETAPISAANQSVETEGFVANTTGPQIARQGKDITVVSVPKLERLRLTGNVVRVAVMNLKAPDLELKGAPDVELTYQPIVGISGGPVVANGKVIAMNSFADPWSFKHTWALQLRGPTKPILLP